MNVITKERDDDDEDDAFANIERLLRDITRGKKNWELERYRTVRLRLGDSQQVLSTSFMLILQN